MQRLLLTLCLLTVCWLITSLPSAQHPSANTVELVGSDLGADHDSSTHTVCDVSCFGCGHSVHDMCPSTLLPLDTLQEQPAVHDALLTLRHGHRHSRLRPPRSSSLLTA